MATEQKKVSEQLKLVPSATRSTVTAARRLIRAAAPGADEIAYQSEPPRSKSAMWKLARYAVDGANVAGIGTFSRYAALFFYRGRELDNSSGLLEGSGKDSRFVRLMTPADAERPAVKRLVREAFAVKRARD
jgi:hypothetical protein